MAPATINRRLAALRSMVALAQTVGMVPFALSVTGAKGQAYRDTRGPGDDGFLRMLVVADLRADAKGVRDRVILRLLHDLALRRGEVVSLDLAHVEQGARTINVLGKGKTGRLPLRLPDPTRDALAAWIVARGDEPGPLFTNLDPTGKGQRLTGVSIYRIVRDIGQQAGIKTWPHGLRHLAITQALDASGGNIRAVRDFSRHASIQTITLYDDKRNSKQGEIAALVAGFTVPRTVRGRAKK
jgi:integrase/recombinase XerC